MNLDALGTYYLDESRYASPLTAPRHGAGGGEETQGGFAALLNQAQADSAAPSGDEGPAGDTPRLSNRKPQVDKADKLYEQCEALETFLVKTLITGMRNTVQKSDLLSGGFAGKMYEDMLYDEYAKDFTKNADFGLAELAYLELTGQRGKK